MLIRVSSLSAALVKELEEMHACSRLNKCTREQQPPTARESTARLAALCRSPLTRGAFAARTTRTEGLLGGLLGHDS